MKLFYRFELFANAERRDDKLFFICKHLFASKQSGSVPESKNHIASYPGIEVH